MTTRCPNRLPREPLDSEGWDLMMSLRSEGEDLPAESSPSALDDPVEIVVGPPQPFPDIANEPEVASEEPCVLI
jgi:hypothetical protein